MPDATNAEAWELAGGPEPMVPWEHPLTSAAWVWTLRHRGTSRTRELSVRVSWTGFASIDEVPSETTRQAFTQKGRPGVVWFLTHTTDWAEIIFHSQSRNHPHGSTGSHPVVRLPPE